MKVSSSIKTYWSVKHLAHRRSPMRMSEILQQTEEKIHSMDTRKPLKCPDKSPPSKTCCQHTVLEILISIGSSGEDRTAAEGISSEERGEGSRKIIRREISTQINCSTQVFSTVCCNTSSTKNRGGNTPNKTEK